MKTAIAIVLAVILIGAASHVHACSCAFLTPTEQLQASDLVVTASVVSVNDVDAGGGLVIRRAVVEVDASWKGGHLGALVVETNVVASCNLEFTVGTKYLIYANAVGDGELFATHECMRTQPAEFASTDFEQLGPPSEVSTGAVEATWGAVKSHYR